MQNIKTQSFPLRTGWKEIVVTGQGGSIRNSSVSANDLSKELTVYPTDPGIAPPQATEAYFTILPVTLLPGSNPKAESREIKVPSPNAEAIQNPQTMPQSLIRRRTNSRSPLRVQGLTPAVILLALASAFLFGALHALSPGHGKAMVAAYLVGTQGTAWHAVLLGLVVTLTHTLGVFALGLLTLSASRYIVPERLYPLISGASGAAVAMYGPRAVVRAGYRHGAHHEWERRMTMRKKETAWKMGRE